MDLDEVPAIVNRIRYAASDANPKKAKQLRALAQKLKKSYRHVSLLLEEAERRGFVLTLSPDELRNELSPQIREEDDLDMSHIDLLLTEAKKRVKRKEKRRKTKEQAT